MNSLFDYLQFRWLPFVFVVVACLLGAITLWFRWKNKPWMGWLIATAFFGISAAGGLIPGLSDYAPWIALVGFGLLVILFVIVVLTGNWSNLGGACSAAILVFGLGCWWLPLADLLVEVGLFVYSLEPVQPWWLLLLLVIPLIIWFSFRSLAGLGPTRRVLAITFRCFAVALLALGMAKTQARRQNEDLTVLFLWDRSLSALEYNELGEDLQKKRFLKFINKAVAFRGPDRAEDKVGVMVFGRYPRLEFSPGNVPQLRLRRIRSKVDKGYTDIASAIKLALASFQEGTSKRIVLMSDGNQNLGDALQQARVAKQNGVEIDVVLMTAGQQRQSEVLVERIEVPPTTEKDSQIPLRIILRSHHPRPVKGMLTLRKTSLEIRGGRPQFNSKKILEPTEVVLQPGLNTFYFQDPGSKQESSSTYEAHFNPIGLANDRVENNRASASVIARGQRAVLVVESFVGKHKLLIDRLRGAKSSLKILSITPETLPNEPGDLALVLSKFDSVILADVPADQFSEEQQKVIRSNTHEMGAGLVMIGGPQSFGAGGWQGTEVEKALPVTCDLKSVKVEGKSGLVLIMHASELAEGNFWQKKVAKIAVEKLTNNDMIGMVYWDGMKHIWHIPFQQIGPNKAKILGRIDSMAPGDMPDAKPSMEKAYKALSDPKHMLGTKHIIFISDGDHWTVRNLIPVMAKIRAKKISCTTVCITTHGAPEKKRLARVAQMSGKGRSYVVTNGKQLPAIYIKESRLISKAFVYAKKFMPIFTPLGGPTEGIPKNLDPLYGFVRTTKRPSPLVEVPIQTPKISGYSFPVLAYWQYGLGRAVAFTSDARTNRNIPKKFWDFDWANSEMHGKFWEQLVEWSLRAVESGKNLNMSTERVNGKVRIIVDARDDSQRPLTKVKLKVGITSPSLKNRDANLPEIKFQQTSAGVYEAEVDAEEIGSYFLNVQASWPGKDNKIVRDSARGSFTVRYSPEYAEMSSNAALLEQIADITGGKVYTDSGAFLDRIAGEGVVFRPSPLKNRSLQSIWPWLIFFSAVFFFLDIATRRIALEPEKWVAKGQEFWAQLRGLQTVSAKTPEFLDRLKSRKSQVGVEMDRGKANRRFAAGETPAAPPPGPGEPADQSSPATPKSSKPAPKESEKTEEGYFSRLQKAKKKTWEDRDND